MTFRKYIDAVMAGADPHAVAEDMLDEMYPAPSAEKLKGRIDQPASKGGFGRQKLTHTVSDTKPKKRVGSGVANETEGSGYAAPKAGSVDGKVTYKAAGKGNQVIAKAKKRVGDGVANEDEFDEDSDMGRKADMAPDVPHYRQGTANNIPTSRDATRTDQGAGKIMAAFGKFKQTDAPSRMARGVADTHK